MESKNNTHSGDELAVRKRKVEQELNDLRDLKNRVNKVEAEMRSDIEWEYGKLNRLEDILTREHIDVGDAVERIKYQLKEYSERALDEESAGSVAFNKKIAELEDKLDSIKRQM